MGRLLPVISDVPYPLRDNKPEEKSGPSYVAYLGLLDPDSFRRDGRGSATASLTDVARSDDVHHSHSNATSVTNVYHLPNSPCVEEDKKGVDKEKGRSIEELEAPEFKRNHSTDIILQRAIEKERSREASQNVQPGTIKRTQFTFSVDQQVHQAPSSTPVKKPDTKPSAEFTKRTRAAAAQAQSDMKTPSWLTEMPPTPPSTPTTASSFNTANSSAPSWCSHFLHLPPIFGDKTNVATISSSSSTFSSSDKEEEEEEEYIPTSAPVPSSSKRNSVYKNVPPLSQTVKEVLTETATFSPITSSIHGRVALSQITSSIYGTRSNTPTSRPHLTVRTQGLVNTSSSGPDATATGLNSAVLRGGSSGESATGDSLSNPTPGGVKAECSNCSATHTPIWRRGLNDELNCNACGLYWKLHKRPRPKSMRSSHGEGRTQVVPRQLEETVDVISSSSVAVQCYNCHTTATTLWWKDGEGNTVCDVCGSYYKLHDSTRPISMKSDVIRKRSRPEDTPSASPDPYQTPLSPHNPLSSALHPGPYHPDYLTQSANVTGDALSSSSVDSVDIDAGMSPKLNKRRKMSMDSTKEPPQSAVSFGSFTGRTGDSAHNSTVSSASHGHSLSRTMTRGHSHSLSSQVHLHSFSRGRGRAKRNSMEFPFTNYNSNGTINSGPMLRVSGNTFWHPPMLPETGSDNEGHLFHPHSSNSNAANGSEASGGNSGRTTGGGRNNNNEDSTMDYLPLPVLQDEDNLFSTFVHPPTALPEDVSQSGRDGNDRNIRSSESSRKLNLGAGDSASQDSQRHDLEITEAGEDVNDGEQARHLGVSLCPEDNLDSSDSKPCEPTFSVSQSSLVRREMMIRKRKSKSMVQGKEITISGGNLTNVEGNYHEHNNYTYVIEETPTYRRYLDAIPDMFKTLDAKLNNLLNFPPKEYNRMSDDSSSSRQTMHSSSRVENENMGDTSAHVYEIETHFNSLNDPPQPTSVFDDGYCIYQTPTPSRINDFTPNSRTFSAMAQDGYNLSSGNQHPYPFGYWVPGIVHYLPCWLPSWGGWIASWTRWISPPAWIWPSFF